MATKLIIKGSVLNRENGKVVVGDSVPVEFGAFTGQQAAEKALALGVGTGQYLDLHILEADAGTGDSERFERLRDVLVAEVKRANERIEKFDTLSTIERLSDKICEDRQKLWERIIILQWVSQEITKLKEE